MDPPVALRIVGNKAFQKEADGAAACSCPFANKNGILPLRSARTKVFLVNISPDVATKYGLQVVSTPQPADVAIVRTSAPFQTLDPGYAMGHFQHEGDLDFKADNPDLVAIQRAAAKVPTIVTFYLDRPAILGKVVAASSALLGNFGISDDALLSVITGKDRPLGHLPFELPLSMAEVLSQQSDVPRDTKHPLFPFGFGLSY